MAPNGSLTSENSRTEAAKAGLKSRCARWHKGDEHWKPGAWQGSSRLVKGSPCAGVSATLFHSQCQGKPMLSLCC